MINRELIEKSFDGYVAGYDLTDEQINLKAIHTRMVAKLTDEISESLELSQDDRDIMWTIGMLHDIGRFEQVKRYHTFVDSRSVDHAKFGADLLFIDGLIDKFGGDGMQDEELELIELAIRQHNRYRIRDNLSARKQMFCNIIRDADKLDIMRVNRQSSIEAVYGVSDAELKNSLVTDEVMANFREKRCVSRDIRVTPADSLVGHISFAFELVYAKSREIALKQGFIFQMLDFESNDAHTRECFSEMNKIMREYLC